MVETRLHGISVGPKCPEFMNFTERLKFVKIQLSKTNSFELTFVPSLQFVRQYNSDALLKVKG